MPHPYSIDSVRTPGYSYNNRKCEFVRTGYHTRFETEEEARSIASTLSEHYQIVHGDRIIYDSYIDGVCEGIDPRTYGGE
jgi:hypothetical protein